MPPATTRIRKVTTGTSGLDLLCPAVVHHGLAPEAIERRRAVLDAAYSTHPECFVSKVRRRRSLRQTAEALIT